MTSLNPQDTFVPDACNRCPRASLFSSRPRYCRVGTTGAVRQGARRLNEARWDCCCCASGRFDSGDAIGGDSRDAVRLPTRGHRRHVLICAALPLLATVSSVPALIATLFMFGAGLGTVDSTVNLQAVIVERASGKNMMSGFHGLFSLGGIVGAAGVSALLGLGLSPLGAMLVVVAVLIGALFKCVPHMLPYGSESSGPAFAVPHGIVLFIGGMCFIVFLTEGAALDWSAVFLAQERGIDTAYAGLGYAAFALTMTAGRLMGDRIVRSVGATRIILFGGLLAAAGLFLATFAPSWQLALVGYALVGAGCSNIVPVLYTAVGKQTVMPESIAVPAITTLGYAGILAGAAVIGFVAYASSLSFAFGLMAVLLVAVAIGGKVLKV